MTDNLEAMVRTLMATVDGLSARIETLEADHTRLKESFEIHTGDRLPRRPEPWSGRSTSDLAMDKMFAPGGIGADVVNETAAKNRKAGI